MIVLGATIKAKAGKEQQLIEVFKRLAAEVQQEEGCLMYIFNQDKKDPTTFLVYEQYVDQAAVDAHANSNHFKTIGKEMGEFMDGRPGLVFYEQVAGFKK
jgi:quinol monooxygenase YgiN